jgi:hypothetical protein
MLTGFWKLNPKKSTSQREVLKLMGRPSWQLSAIDKANENFCILHFQRKINDKIVNYFEKFVVIYLDSTVLKLLSTILPGNIDQVKYHHKLFVNGKKQEHENDEKQFGKCSSLTTWERHNNNEGFTIRWYIRRGILKVFHFINKNDELQVELEMTNATGETAKAVKIYERHEMPKDRQEYINHLPNKLELLQ